MKSHVCCPRPREHHLCIQALWSSWLKHLADFTSISVEFLLFFLPLQSFFFFFYTHWVHNESLGDVSVIFHRMENWEVKFPCVQVSVNAIEVWPSGTVPAPTVTPLFCVYCSTPVNWTWSACVKHTLVSGVFQKHLRRQMSVLQERMTSMFKCRVKSLLHGIELTWLLLWLHPSVHHDMYRLCY